METRLDKYAVSPEQVVLLHSCLSSKLCMRIFNILLSERRHVNISAICRKAGCTSGNAVKHLRRLVKLGAAEEKFLSGLHMFTVKRGEMAELLYKAERILEAERMNSLKFEGLHAAGQAYPTKKETSKPSRIQPQRFSSENPI